ncbi:hypothetical protein [Kineococcus glutinatus]|uniref:Lipoprotein LprG n=1 Tax=Kineococcus glutinatus TaxID=1070872 RepID=A0ABP8VGF8_9ACTN
MPAPSSTRRPARTGRRAAALLAGAAALTAGLGACSASPETGAEATGTDRTPLEVVNASLAKSTETATAKFALDVQASGEGENATVTGEGAFDAAQEAAEVRLQITAPGVSGLQPTVRLTGDTLYVTGVPGIAAGAWLQAPLETGADLGLDAHALNPAEQLQQLRAVSSDVRELGTSTVRGVEATGYAGTIDLRKALDSASTPAERAEAEKALADSGVSEVPFELYVDSEDRPVRMVVDASAEHEGQRASATVSVDYFDWGTDVDVAAPPADAIVEAPAELAATEALQTS